MTSNIRGTGAPAKLARERGWAEAEEAMEAAGRRVIWDLAEFKSKPGRQPLPPQRVQLPRLGPWAAGAGPSQGTEGCSLGRYMGGAGCSSLPPHHGQQRPPPTSEAPRLELLVPDDGGRYAQLLPDLVNLLEKFMGKGNTRTRGGGAGQGKVGCLNGGGGPAPGRQPPRSALGVGRLPWAPSFQQLTAAAQPRPFPPTPPCPQCLPSRGGQQYFWEWPSVALLLQHPP